jgi:sugar/nucleoside kinase (ribokinase family)
MVKKVERHRIGPHSEKGTFLGVFGHVNIDWLVDAGTKPPTEKGPFFGGVGGNIAIAAARFGLPVSLASIVGRDFPEDYLSLLKDVGINIDFLEKDDSTDTSTCRLTTYPDGHDEKEMYNGPQNDDIRTPVEFVKDTTYVHISTGFPHPCLWLSAQAHSAGCKVVFDPSADLERYYDPTLLLSILKYSDYYFMNEKELAVTMDLLAMGSERDVLTLVEMAVVTKGRHGSMLITRDKVFSIPAIEPEKVIDPTGAGDAYRAGFYTGLYNGFDLKDSCFIGSVAASECVIWEGAQVGLQSWEDLLARYEHVQDAYSIDEVDI